jgi:hypothetical protein
LPEIEIMTGVRVMNTETIHVMNTENLHVMNTENGSVIITESLHVMITGHLPEGTIKAHFALPVKERKDVVNQINKSGLVW